MFLLFSLNYSVADRPARVLLPLPLLCVCPAIPCSKLNGCVATVVKGMEAYEFSVATSVSLLLLCCCPAAAVFGLVG